MADQTWLQRLLRIEPGIALTQWAADRILNNWPFLVALFVGAGGMSVLASITGWLKALGPAGIGAAILATFILSWIGLNLVRYLRAKTRERHANADAVDKWKQDVDGVNPLDTEFQRKRLRVLELAHPLTKHIANKRFIDCQLMGPANVGMIGKGSITGAQFSGCDIVVLTDREDIPIHNAVFFNSCQIIGGEILSCTIYIPPAMIPQFEAMGARFISFTGKEGKENPPINPDPNQGGDTLPPQEPEEKT